MEYPENQEQECQYCNGTGVVKDPQGGAHVCYECLKRGKLDVHSKNLKDSGIEI